MNITKKLYAPTRNEWRAWLEKHHSGEPEIWLVYYRKRAARPSIPYDEAVEEALCFGWIDSQVKNIDEDRYAQRFSPRREGSNLSETNKERVRRLIKAGKMTEAGMDKVRHHLAEVPFAVPGFILDALRENVDAWKNFERFPESYKRIRVGWIANSRVSDRKRRLAYFVRMTAKNKKYGMVH